MERPRQTRRRFLGSLILALTVVPLWRFLTPRTIPNNPALRIGRDTIPFDGALVFRESRVAVMRTAEEIYALNLTCTHLGCTVTVTSTGMICPCHGSRFDRNGEVLSGPASRRLEQLEVRIDGDDVVVFS